MTYSTMKTESNSNKDIIIQTLSATGRPGMDRVLAELEQNGFYEAPGSIKYHSNYKGGLAEHSLAVYRCAMDLKRTNPKVYGSVSDESIAMTALLHDICKADVYFIRHDGTLGKSMRNFPIGHGEKSVIVLLQSGLELTKEEILAIRWHMSAWDLPFQSYELMGSLNAAREKTPLLGILQAADGLSANVLETK